MMNVEQLAKTLNAVDSDLSRMKDPLEPLKVASDEAELFAEMTKHGIRHTFAIPMRRA